jgi:hypothetical protein
MEGAKGNSNSASGILGTSSGPVIQALYGIVFAFLVYIVLYVCEVFYGVFINSSANHVVLFPNTYVSGSKMYTAIQNPMNPKAKTVYFSENQRSGVEFSYAMFLNIKSETFSAGERKLYHILHKGYGQVYPLLGPGIFCWGDSNTIRVYMNCFEAWNNYCEIENIPVDKWFHLTLTCKGNVLYLYINGNLKKKMPLLNNTPPYQNYGNVYAFSPRKLTLSKTITTSLETEDEFKSGGSSNLVFDGAAKGMISRVNYFAYALTYTEIQSLINMQPSTVMEGPDMSLIPYLSDTWWANKQGP